MKPMKWVFASNYINHHQLPFCDAMYELLQGSFAFIQTMEMEEERVRMGWSNDVDRPYLRYAYKEPEACQELMDNCEVLIYGGVEDESYLQNRLKAGGMIFRYTERVYKTGQWRAISPRGLRRKYLDHTRYRRQPVYLLCAGAYVASDFQIFRAYPEKKFVWGYFPAIVPQDVDNLLKNKGYRTEEGKTIPRLLWAGRFLDWKHPELAVETARHLKEKGLEFHLEMVGDGDQRPYVEELIDRYDLQEYVTLLGYQSPEEVRRRMEQANIYLFTSDRNEGWGAVANEAMNSACAMVADTMIGAVPYLVRHGENGYVYPDGHPRELYVLAEKLVRDKSLCERLGREAYRTVAEVWNPENAAKQLILLSERLQPGDQSKKFSSAVPGGERFTPCMPAPVIPERRMYEYLTRK